VPYYEIIGPQNSADRKQKDKIAEGITKIHCEETGAPVAFVHVHFKDYPKDSQYTGGQPDNEVVIIFCNIRAGRSLAERQRLLKRVSSCVSEALQKPESLLMLSVNEVNSITAMEFGLILPHPGGEPEWFEKHADKLKGVVSLN
jgi:phenylpyruvate tautomerase PptA (4-oxalocrotonate tautomerase family)